MEPTAAAALSLAMTAMGTDFENSFRRFLAQPDTQEVVAEEQKKEEEEAWPSSSISPPA